MRREKSNVFGRSRRETILLYAGCCLVLSTLMSFNVKEKNAISDPAKRKDNTKSTNRIKTSNVVAAGVIAMIVSS